MAAPEHPGWQDALALLPWRVSTERWGEVSCGLRQVCGVFSEAWHPVLHRLCRGLEQQLGGVAPKVLDLPYDWLVRAVFTTASLKAGLDCRGARFSHGLLVETLERLGLDSLPGLAAELRGWASSSQAANDSLANALLPGGTKRICEPAIWLLDAVHTMQCVLSGELRPSPKMRCQSACRKGLLELIEELALAGASPDPRAAGERATQFSPKRRRTAVTRMEHLVWLAMEGRRCDLVLALVWHCRRIDFDLHGLVFPPSVPIDPPPGLWDDCCHVPDEAASTSDGTGATWPSDAGDAPGAVALLPPPPPPLWGGGEPPHLEDALGLTDLCLLPYDAPYWHDNFVKLRELCGEAPQAWYPLLHELARRLFAAHARQEQPCDEPTLSCIPFNRLVRVVFTRAADRAMQSCRGEMFTYRLLHLVLRQLDLDTIEGLKAALLALRDAPVEGGSVRKTLSFNLTATELQHLNRPGAWLLDSIHTHQLVLAGQIRDVPGLRYKVVSNKRLGAMMGYCFPDEIAKAHAGCRAYGTNLNNIGNQAEHLAWLALEADRCEVILALAWHTRLMPLEDCPPRIHRKRREAVVERGVWHTRSQGQIGDEGQATETFRILPLVNVVVVETFVATEDGQLSAIVGECVQVLELGGGGGRGGGRGAPGPGWLLARRAMAPEDRGWLPAACVHGGVSPAELTAEGLFVRGAPRGAEEEDEEEAVAPSPPAWAAAPLPRYCSSSAADAANAAGAEERASPRAAPAPAPPGEEEVVPEAADEEEEEAADGLQREVVALRSASPVGLGYLRVEAGDRLEVLYRGSAAAGDAQWLYARSLAEPQLTGWLLRSVVR